MNIAHVRLNELKPKRNITAAINIATTVCVCSCQYVTTCEYPCTNGRQNMTQSSSYWINVADETLCCLFAQEKKTFSPQKVACLVHPDRDRSWLKYSNYSKRKLHGHGQGKFMKTSTRDDTRLNIIKQNCNPKLMSRFMPLGPQRHWNNTVRKRCPNASFSCGL